jgi:hypothetical protein
MNGHDRLHDALEHELRQALRREEAPAGFAERVLAKAQAQATPESWWQRWVRGLQAGALRYATVAVLVVATVVGAVEYKRHEQDRRQGEFARQQLMLALRIASGKLQYAQAKVNRTGHDASRAGRGAKQERQ